MANQDSGFIGVNGELLANATAHMIIDGQLGTIVGTLVGLTKDTQVLVNSGYIVTSGVLNGDIIGKQNGPYSVALRGEAGFSVSPKVYSNTGAVIFNGTLGSETSVQLLVNSYSSMFGFLSSSIVNAHALVYCADLDIDMVVQTINSSECTTKGVGVELKRFRRDTYPVYTVLGRNGNTNIAGHTFKMSTRIDNETLYIANGVILDEISGRVSFVLDPLATAVAGSGIYDIEGNDGTYVYTYQKGVYTILEDLTV